MRHTKRNDRSRAYYILILTVLLVTAFLGYQYGLIQNNDYRANFTEFISCIASYKPMMLLSSIILQPCIVFFAITPLGILLEAAYLLYIAFSFGFVINGVINVSATNSLILLCVYFLLYFIIPCFIMSAELYYVFKLNKRSFNRIVKRKMDSNSHELSNNLKRVVIIAIFCIFYNLILFLIGGKFLSIIAFL